MSLKAGNLRVDKKEIYYKMSSAEFFSLYSSDVDEYKRDDLIRYEFKDPKQIEGLSMWLDVIFVNNIISTMELKNADPKLRNSYEDWSNDRMAQSRNNHDEWLIQQLGEASDLSPAGITYNCDWGSAVSFLDPKGGDTGIYIQYKYD